ncbi:hypothetical protein HQ590_12685 [bacterium]|nr:hypothetical protein [bacterium]
MMGTLNIEICPETGICSIVKGDGSKIDLMPDEVDGLRQASGQPDAMRQVLAEVDEGFAGKLESEEIDQLAARLK